MLNSKRLKAFVSLATIIAIVLNIMMFVSFAPDVNAAVVDSGKCGDNVNWELDDVGTLTISGTGDTYDYDTHRSNESPFDFNLKIKKVIIQDGVTSIGSDLFAYCWNMTEISIPDSVSKIGSGAFYFCEGLALIDISANITDIGNCAFAGCKKIHYAVDTNNPNYCCVDGVLFNKDKTVLINYPISSTATSYVIPNTVKSLGDYSFAYCPYLTDITIPDSVTTIGERVFHSNTALTSITIPGSVKSMGELVFAYCRVLKDVNFLEGVTCIDQQEFLGCKSLETIYLPSTINEIGWGAFSDCEKLKDITVDENNTKFKDINGVLFDSKGYELISYPEAKTETSYEIPNGVYRINNSAFSRAKNLTPITIPKSVKSISVGTFNSRLETIIGVPGSYAEDYAQERGYSFEKRACVIFDSKGGSDVATQYFQVGGTPTKPSDPTKEGYVFEGWYDDYASEFDFGEAVSEQKTAYAKWTKAPTSTPTTSPSTGPTTEPTTKPTTEPTTVPATAPTSAPSTGGGFEEFVERLYTVALNRASEPEGKAFWCLHVGNGDLNGAQCANEFLLSKEFKDRNLSNEEFLKVLYKTFFDRDAANDPDGFNFWMNCLKTQGRDSVVDCFINSEEWCNVCASYGVKAGATRAKATIASKNATAFATRLYTECLGREPEEGGLKFWSLGLTNLELSGKQAAHEFFFSKEFNDFNLDNKGLLTRMYTTFMDRQPDTDGMNYWLNEMSNGMTKEQVFECFVNSAEFTQICKDYAIDRG